MLMLENLRGERRPVLLDFRGSESHGRSVRWFGTILETIAASAPHAVGPATLLTAIGQVANAIRQWRRRTRSPQQLHELTDHLLKDIGLRREEVIYQTEKRGDARWTR